MEAVDQNHRLAFLAAAQHHDPAFANAWYMLSPMGGVQELATLFREHCVATLPARVKQTEFVISTLEGMARKYPERARMIQLEVQSQRTHLARLYSEAVESFC